MDLFFLDYSELDGLKTFAMFLLVFFIFFLAMEIFYYVSSCLMYKKAGNSGWEAIIPFYNSWVYVEIAGLDWWWFLVLNSVFVISVIGDGQYAIIAGLVSLFGYFCCNYNISKKLHRDIGFAILMTIFPYVMIPIIRLSKKYQFDSSVSVSEMGPFGDNKVQSSVQTTTYNENNGDSTHKFCSYCGAEIKQGYNFCEQCGNKVE